MELEINLISNSKAKIIWNIFNERRFGLLLKLYQSL